MLTVSSRQERKIAVPADRLRFPMAEQARESVASATDEIRALLAELDREAREGMGEWSGEARAAYEECKASWDAAAAGMRVCLRRADDALSEISAGCQQAESTGVTMWAGDGR
ncbi:WXG100 family type VII secretion target [Amycolatopsis sp. CA-230715]|uniref:WXG100 family type VII secretion target n=1 Tax=Amycolatopsis sp. CA-230715 TaxID=2745196 RepID=UPI001C01F79D|nr:WXG100 family type VII secretion target [Amycolatopsis sp. CA-230715]